jgi:hypothetical protein
MSPVTDCDPGMTAFAALTFCVFTVCTLIGAWLLTAFFESHPLALHFTRPYNSRWSVWLWAVPHRFGRKLWFALLISGWNFRDPAAAAGASARSLATVVFLSLVALLLLQLWLRPYRNPDDNRLDIASILLLQFGYFVSVLPGAATATEVAVSLLEGALVIYGLQRAWRHLRSLQPRSDESANSQDALDVDSEVVMAGMTVPMWSSRASQSDAPI